MSHETSHESSVEPDESEPRPAHFGEYSVRYGDSFPGEAKI